MFRISLLISLPVFILTGGNSFSQTIPSPNQHSITQGRTWTPSEWGTAFSSKQDVNGDSSGQHVTANGVTNTLGTWMQLLTGGSSGAILNAPLITNLADPTTLGGAASKHYVDSLLAGGASPIFNGITSTAYVSIKGGIGVQANDGSASSAYLYSDSATSNQNDFVVRTGASGAFHFSLFDQYGALYIQNFLHSTGVTFFASDSSTSDASIYTDIAATNANDLVFRTGPSTAYAYTFIDGAGSVHVPGSAFVGGNISLAGTITGATNLGSASSRTASDVTQLHLASVSSSATIGHLAVFADGNGTIYDAGASPITHAALSDWTSATSGFVTSVAGHTGGSITLNAGDIGGLGNVGSGLYVSAGVLEVSYGVSANQAAQGNDSRITGAFQTSSIPTSALLGGSGSALTSISVGSGLTLSSGTLSSSGVFGSEIVSNAGIVAPGLDAGGFNLRIPSTHYGVGLRNDDANFWILLTNSTTTPLTASWNGFQPFSIALATGQVIIGNGLTVHNGLTVEAGTGISLNDALYLNASDASASHSQIYTDFATTNANDVVFRTGPSTAYKYTVIDQYGTLNVPGNIEMSGLLQTNLVNYVQAVDWTNTPGSSLAALVLGSLGNPDNTITPTLSIQKITTGLASLQINTAGSFTIFKTGNGDGTHATAIYAIAQDNASAYTHTPGSPLIAFMEGGRFEATANGMESADIEGVIAQAGTNAGAPYTYLIGMEPTIQNNTDNPTMTFDTNHFSANIVASCGYQGTSAHNCDVGFLLNPFATTLAHWMRGLYAPSGTIDSVGTFIQADGSMNIGIDFSQVTGAFAWAVAPNNIPLRAENHAGSAALNIAVVDGSDTAFFASDTGISAVNISNASSPVYINGPLHTTYLPTTPGGKQPVCIDPSTGVVYKGSAGAC